MSLTRLHMSNPRLLIGTTITMVGVAALYNAMWLKIIERLTDDPLMLQAMLLLWPTSIIAILVGLLTLPPGRGRAISWSCFVLFVLAIATHFLVRGLYFNDRFLWWP